MKQYLELLDQVLTTGSKREDRTGTGTIGIFGTQTRYDLSKGFPAMTTKRLFFRGVVEELLWMLRGSTDVQELEDVNVKIWSEWKKPNGTIGPGYGKQFRNSNPVGKLTVQAPRTSSEKVLEKGEGSYEVPEESVLGRTWADMMNGCYNPSSKDYCFYGKQGFKVSESWESFEVFKKDVQRIPGWYNKKTCPSKHVLDTSYYGSKVFGPETTVWLPKSQVDLYPDTPLYIAYKDYGEEVPFISLQDFARDYGIDLDDAQSWFDNLGNHPYVKWKLKKSPSSPNWRYDLPHDQLLELVNSLKHDPYSRRHIISLWSPSETSEMALPPCHGISIQFYVSEDKKLSCSMYQRSADLFLGVPFNIAFYSLFTHMLAQVCGYDVGEFIHITGDTHIYSNHVDQVKEQLSREPLPLPTLKLNPDVKDIRDFTFEDIELVDYKHLPTIKAPVSV